MTSVRIVSLRPPARAGSGDVMRAQALADALESGGYDVHIVSVLGPGERLLRALLTPSALGAFTQLLLACGRSMPLQWIAVQAVARARRLRLTGPELPVFVTARVAPAELPPRYVVDFVDALSRGAGSRAENATWLRWLWRREQRLLARWEAELAEQAAMATAVSDKDAAAIGPTVLRVPIAVTHAPQAVPRVSPARATAIFAGSLYYGPNADAARWIMSDLVAPLSSHSWAPDQIVIAGRRPAARLRADAARAGVRMLADVEDMASVLATATVAIAPMRLGSGMQTKVVEALRAGVPVVLTPKANEGLGLQDSPMVRVVERDPVQFARAVAELGRVGRRPAEQAGDVAQLLASCLPETVARVWRRVLEPVIGAP